MGTIAHGCLVGPPNEGNAQYFCFLEGHISSEGGLLQYLEESSRDILLHCLEAFNIEGVGMNSYTTLVGGEVWPEHEQINCI